MVESKEAAFELLIPHEQLAKAIEPAEPSSWPRRYSAIATRCLQNRRTRPTRLSTGLRIRLLSATQDSACEWHSRYQIVRLAAPSTDSPCARRKRWPRIPAAPLWVCAHPRLCVHILWRTPADALAAAARPAAKRRPILPMPATSFSSLVSPSLISPHSDKP